MSSQATYQGFPAAVDFGTVTIGNTNSPVQQVRIQYNLAPSQSVGGVLTSQTNISSEVFAIDDQGSNAEELVLLSTDGNNFYNRVNLASFPATEPPNTITLYVQLNLTTANALKISNTGDFIVYLTSVQVPAFQVPIHFRITNGLYLSASDVRQSMGDFGKQRSTTYSLHDIFSDTTAPLWTNVQGGWNYPIGSTRAGTSTSGTDALSFTNFQDAGDYNISAWVTLTTAGQAGFLFSYVNSSNYYRAYIDTNTGKVGIDSVLSGTVTTLNTTSVGVVTNSPYELRVEKHPTSATIYFGGNSVLNAAGITFNGPPGLYVQKNSSPATAYYQEYHISEDSYVFADDQINTLIQEEQEFIEQRIGKFFSTQTITELRDWDERQPLRMPFLAARSFNMLPSGTQLMGTGTDQRLFATGELAMYLRQRPVLNVIALEEDTAVDGTNPVWTLRTQGRNGDYIVYPEIGKIVWLNNLPNNGHQNIKIVYTVGAAKVPAYIRGYLKEKVALRLLENVGSGADGIKELVLKKTENMNRYEEFIPQKTLQYVSGSGQPIR